MDTGVDKEINRTFVGCPLNGSSREPIYIRTVCLK